MDRAYTACGLLEIRALDDGQRILEGVASTDLLDDYGTILEPGGARFTLPMPLLWLHDQASPVGEVTSAEVVGNQLRVRAQIRKIEEPGAFKDLTDKAWQGVRHKLVKGFSVGFLPIKQIKERFTEWAWRELSLVTLPANSQATISRIRSSIAASGDPPKNPGVSGQSPPLNPRPKMTIAEQISQHENSRAAKVAQQTALMEKSGADGTTLDATQQETFDTLGKEIEAHDGQLLRLRSLKLANDKAATPVNGNNTEAASQSRSGVPVVTLKDNLEPGIKFARHCIALAVSRGNKYEAAQYAKERWGDQADELVAGIRAGGNLQSRAAVAPGTTLQATFAAPLVITNYITDMLPLLRAATLIGRIPGLRSVPFNVSMPVQTAGGTYKWVGQGKAKPVTNAQYASVTLSFAKASGIIVLTDELVRLSSPSAEAAVRDELVKGITAFLDTQFVDSTVAAVANVNPASITNGVAGSAATGTTGAFARTDIAAKVATFAAAGYNMAGLVILMSESQAFNLGLALNAVATPLFPGLTMQGGNILGIPVVTSQAVGSQIIIAHAPSILIADEGGIEVDVSREASLQLDSAPTDPPDATAVMTSLWQMNLVGLRVERYITWGKARSTAVDRITSTAYVP